MALSRYFRETAILSAAAALLLTAPALAQVPADEAPGATSSADEPATPSFSEEELRAYVETEAKVVEISQRYQRQHGDETDPEKLNQIRAQMNQELLDAVSQGDIEIERFNEIVRAVRADSELAEKVAQMR